MEKLKRHLPPLYPEFYLGIGKRFYFSVYLQTNIKIKEVFVSADLFIAGAINCSNIMFSECFVYN
jgi:hypothetical protein